MSKFFAFSSLQKFANDECFIFITMVLFSIALVRAIPVDSGFSSLNSSDLCAEREVVGAFADPSDTDCTSYVHCYNLNGEWLTKLLKCPEGQFFDVSFSICSSLYKCSR